MPGYLQLSDYKTYIQGDYFRQLVQGDDDKRVIEENTSLQTIAQRLVQRYDLDAEFTVMAPYSATKNYGAGIRVTVDVNSGGFAQWVTLTAYTKGALVINSGFGYKCNTANTDATFTPSKWTVVAPQFTVYYGAYPACTLAGQPNPATLTQPYAPVFNYKSVYTAGDVVYWRGYTYVCNQNSVQITHQQALQYMLYSNIPYGNVFPDDPVQNATGQYWKTKTAYTIPAGTLAVQDYDATAAYVVGNYATHSGDTYKCKTNTPTPAGAFDATLWTLANYWVPGDNRNQTIKDAMVRITVFKLSPLIAPKNRPDVWLDDYRSILRELNEAAEGKITMALPLKQPSQGLMTSYGGEVKKINNY